MTTARFSALGPWPATFEEGCRVKLSIEGPSLEFAPSSAYAALLRRVEAQHRLFSVHWELTYRCNERCTHCYLQVFAPHATIPDELTTEECLQVVDQIAAAGALNLTLSGGEILTRRDFFEIAQYARQKRLLLRLFTNGIWIRPRLADRIAALHPYAVEISLYSVQPELHEAITRRRNSWRLSIQAIRLLRERNVRVVVKTPLMRQNVREIDELQRLAQELGASFRYDITITSKDTGGMDPLQYRLTYEDLLWLMRRQLDISRWVNRSVNGDQRPCGIATKAAVIDPYGNVYPCIETRFKAGNLRQQSLQEIWASSPVWQELGRLTLDELPVCRDCALRHLCVRCHGLALREDGNLRAPARVNCREALARRQALVEVQALPADYPIPIHLQQDEEFQRYL